MGNFNIERWQMVVGGNRHSRMIVEECMKWCAIFHRFSSFFTVFYCIFHSFSLFFTVFH